MPIPVLAAGRAPGAEGYDADIMILTMGRFEDTVAAVTSALGQIGVSLHVSVLDQGAPPEIRRGFAAAFGGDDRLAYYTIEQNLGVGGGRNLLASLGHGDVIIGIDNDAVFEHDTVAQGTVRAMAQTPALGAIAYKILAADGVSLDRLSWGYPAALRARFADCFETTTFVGAGHAIRRSAWAQVGGYDAALFFTWEEYDFCLAAIALGWAIRYVGTLGIIHKLAAEGRVAWSATRVRYFVRNRLIIARKWRASWLALVPRMAGYVVKGTLTGRLRPTLAGVFEAIRLDGGRAAKAMPAAMRHYRYCNETKHRGSVWGRLRGEVFARFHDDAV